ncbi:hypothetical protein ACOMHN_036422 [Nucella lapillus]
MFSPSFLHGLSREELITQLEEARAQNEVYELRLRQQDSATSEHTAIQERQSNGVQGDEPLEHGRWPPPLPPTLVRPDVRLVLPDTLGMKVEHPSDEAWSRGNAEMTASGGMGGGGARCETAPTAEWSSQRVLTFAAMAPEEKTDVLMQTVRQYQAFMEEMEQKKMQAERMNHSLLTQLNAAKMVCQETTEAEARRRDEITHKDDQIKALQRQLRQMQNNLNRHLSLRPGIKRGRFVMSKSCTLECSNCRGFFTSEESAGNTPCCCHLKAASELPNKMVAEVFPTELTKLRYWACCQKIGAKMPDPCFRGQHELRAV